MSKSFYQTFFYNILFKQQPVIKKDEEKQNKKLSKTEVNREQLLALFWFVFFVKKTSAWPQPQSLFTQTIKSNQRCAYIVFKKVAWFQNIIKIISIFWIAFLEYGAFTRQSAMREFMTEMRV